MAVIPNQKFRFLGGEVSPNLYHSADMDQYGRWFSKAENIQFDTLGSFRNRNGFQKIAESKSQNGTEIKLLSFSFSKGESYLIEMGPGYFRFFEDGAPVYKNGDPDQGVYEIQHTMSIKDIDIKYAQSGDIMYLVNGVDPVATLTRNDTTGYNWTFDTFKFSNDCYPLKEVNDDDTKTLNVTGGAVVGQAWSMQFSFGCDFLIIKDVTVTVVGSTTKAYTTQQGVFYTGQQLASYLQSTTLDDDYDLTCSFDNNSRQLLFLANGTTTSVTSIEITATYTDSNNIFLSTGRGTYKTISGITGYLYKIYFHDNYYQNKTFSLASGAEVWISNYSFNTQVNTLNTMFNKVIYKGTMTPSNNDTINIHIDDDAYGTSGRKPIIQAYSANLGTVTVTLPTISAVNTNAVTVTSVNHDFFAKKGIGDFFALEYEVGPDSINWNGGNSPAGTTTNTIITNGTFTAVTSGAWSGAFNIEYSTDKVNWIVIRNVVSTDQISNHNINEAITVQADSDIVYVRVVVTSNLSYRTADNISYPLTVYIAGTKFFLNVYHKILKINSATSAACGVVKNWYLPAANVTWYGQKKWKEAAFSSEEGWPSVIGFYQNRLLFGKEHYLFASKTNDFYDFYVTPTLKADDPITMSLLSYRYNRIKNILTVRKFFAFTEEGEFGIQSQAALTQTDKNLIPLSYHGSSDCLPVLAGNLALFVDQTGNCIRLFQYSYETDMFEANDASVFLEQLLKGRKIVTTDYLKKTKEALFLDDSGTIWVFKLMPEQEVYAWSHIKYAASGKIVNMRVVANGADEDLYIAVEDKNLNEKRIEKLAEGIFYDSEKTYTSELRTDRFYTDFAKGTEIVAEYEDKKSKMIVQDNGLIVLEKRVYSVTCHYIYVSQATLLSPTTNLTEGVYTTYNKGKPFKVYFAYQDSFGFKVGLEEEEKMVIRFNGGDRPDSSELTTGKRNVLIPARYDGSSRVTFIQDRPYNMSINNVMIDMDYGGK